MVICKDSGGEFFLVYMLQERMMSSQLTVDFPDTQRETLLYHFFSLSTTIIYEAGTQDRVNIY